VLIVFRSQSEPEWIDSAGADVFKVADFPANQSVSIALSYRLGRCLWCQAIGALNTDLNADKSS